MNIRNPGQQFFKSTIGSRKNYKAVVSVEVGINLISLRSMLFQKSRFGDGEIIEFRFCPQRFGTDDFIQNFLLKFINIEGATDRYSSSIESEYPVNVCRGHIDDVMLMPAECLNVLSLKFIFRNHYGIRAADIGSFTYHIVHMSNVLF